MGFFDTEAGEEGEQLYMLEVVLDSVGVRERRAAAAPDPVLPVLAAVRFLDFPVMEVDRNRLLMVEGADLADKSWTEFGERRVGGLPPEWRTRERRTSYDVEVAYVDRATGTEGTLEVEIPTAVLEAGEGLRFVLAAAKQRLPPDIFASVQERVASQVQADREGAPTLKRHKFSAGKSCLFHMTPAELVGCMAEHSIRVQVYRNSSDGNEFVHTLIGEAKVPLGLPFTKAALLACTPGALYPTTAHLDNSFPMYDNFDREVGEIHVFVRLSCFGEAPFSYDESDEMKKNKFLKNLIKKDRVYQPSGKVDVKYPWKKNLDIVRERPAPRPRLQPEYEPEELPPAPLPEFDFGRFLPNVPRCSPFTPPPCYRRGGDPPLSRCTREMEAQLRREEFTKGAQTESYQQPQVEQQFPAPFDMSDAPKPEDPLSQPGRAAGECTCQALPAELRPSEQGDKLNIQCTCADLMKNIVSPQQPQAHTPAAQQQPKQHVQNVQQSMPLGDSDYEITLTKTECGLEEKNVEKITDKPPDKSGEKISDEKKKVEQPTKKVPPSKKADPNSKTSADDNSKHKETKNKNQINDSVEKPPDGDTVLQENKLPATNVQHVMESTHGITDDSSEEFPKEKKKNIYEPTPGMYPGHQYGHRRCITRQRPVPKHMGWLWTAVNFEGLLKGKGWFPGSIRKDVNSMMNKMKEEHYGSEVQTLKSGKFPKHKHRQIVKLTEVVKYNPNLHVHKKEGYYYVSMIPVKTESQEDAGIEPKPIEYKIDPKHPDGNEDSGEYSDTSSSSNVKSYEMNFIVPLALQRRKRKVDRATLGVQYNEQDFMKKNAKKRGLNIGEKEEEKKDRKDSKKEKDNRKKEKKGKGNKNKKGKK